ncbi:MAG: hypothetical protein JW818_15070 [Pirellulales bacterium]|nr:hypothetical protein [Pirellulales bacterium]
MAAVSFAVGVLVALAFAAATSVTPSEPYSRFERVKEEAVSSVGSEDGLRDSDDGDSSIAPRANPPNQADDWGRLAPIHEALRPGAALPTFIDRLAKQGLWSPNQRVLDAGRLLSMRQLHQAPGFIEARFDFTRVGDGKILIEVVVETGAIADDSRPDVTILFYNGNCDTPEHQGVDRLADVTVRLARAMEFTPEELHRLNRFLRCIAIPRAPFAEEHREEAMRITLNACPARIQRRFDEGIRYKNSFALATRHKVLFISERPAIGADLSKNTAVELAFVPIRKPEFIDPDGCWSLLLHEAAVTAYTQPEPSKPLDNGFVEFTWPRLTTNEVDALKSD